jgi:hypothetical protein
MADIKLDNSNPNAMTYITDELAFTILGGIRLDGLDRLLSRRVSRQSLTTFLPRTEGDSSGLEW